MTDPASLLDLPFTTLLVLGCGYIGYRLAYIGHNSAHSAIDVTFISVIFAAIAQAALLAFSPRWIMIGAATALAAAIASAILWRVWAVHWLRDSLRRRGISDHDGHATVWKSMLSRRLRQPMRLVIKLTNGGALMCSDLRLFYSAPMGPCLLGEDGSVALYVTDTMAPDSEDWVECRPYDPERPAWGYEMSFVPAAQIARIDMTRPA